MKLCAAQLRPVAGDIPANLRKHIGFIEAAAARNADLICFPELSLTGYEPKLARELASRPEDSRWDVFQRLSDSLLIHVGVGLPLTVETGVQIGMLFFTPGAARQAYAKQLLHEDELAFFVRGEKQLWLRQCGHVLAPAICYESLQASHAEAAVRAGADVYLASVAKSAAGVARANTHYPGIAEQHGMTVLMANCLGTCDDFVAAGQSAAWNQQGHCIARLDDQQEGLVLVDTNSGPARQAC